MGRDWPFIIALTILTAFALIGVISLSAWLAEHDLILLALP